MEDFLKSDFMVFPIKKRSLYSHGTETQAGTQYKTEGLRPNI